MKRGDIFLLSLDPTVGHEQLGERPILIISPEEFNNVTKLPIVLPITTGGKFVRTAGFAVSLDECGTATKGVIRCDQPRALDLIFLKGKFLERVSDDIIEDVLARIATYLQ